jgi:superfamily II DNA/RNA helicase
MNIVAHPRKRACVKCLHLIFARKKRAAEVYARYVTQFKTRFKWLAPELFVKSLRNDLESDAANLIQVLKRSGEWLPNKDAKLGALFRLLTKDHPEEKIIIFTQFADTVRYLEKQLKSRGLKAVAGVSGESPDPTGSAWL